MDNLSLTALPESFAAGTTVSYLKTLPGYPNSLWTLTLYLAGAKTASFLATNEGSGFRVTLPADITAELAAGAYTWTERIEMGGPTRLDVATGIVVVQANIADATDGSFQSWAEKTLPIVELAIAGRLPTGMESYQIAGRAVSKIPIADLVKLRSQLIAMIARVQNPTRVSQQVLVKFTQP